MALLVHISFLLLLNSLLFLLKMLYTFIKIQVISAFMWLLEG